MKTSKKLAPALFLLALALATGVGFLSQAGNVQAEGASRAVDATSIKASAGDLESQNRCEQQEVEADEGYGVSRKEVRLVCR
jgi:hypothetical protein